MTCQNAGVSDDRPYHHGDLARALVAAGTELARRNGPDGVVLRAVTRSARVSPTAAYRHFADRESLLAAVSGAARDVLADAMEAALSEIPPRSGSRTRARARLAAIGRAYIGFALAEPGLFRTAFAAAGSPNRETGDRAYGVLVGAVDGLAAAGLIPPRQRAHAEFAAWSAVHGAALLLLNGAGTRPGEDAAPLVDRVVSMVLEGL
jgi:AcrR family transcriptional regulator